VTRYRLPEALGGGEVEGRLIRTGVSVGVGSWPVILAQVEGIGEISVPVSAVTEVKPPLPKEPPNFSTVRIGSRAYVRYDLLPDELNWYGSHGRNSWAELVAKSMESTGFPPVVLVPDPLAEPVKLPWHAVDPHSYHRVQVRVSDADFAEDGAPPRQTVAWVAAGHTHAGSHISAPVARDMARALWAAADQTERAT